MKRVTTLLILLSLAFQTDAQLVGALLKGAIDKKDKAAKEELAGQEWESIGEIAKRWEEGEYMHWSVSEGRYLSPTKKMTVSFDKDDKGEITGVNLYNDSKYTTSSSEGITFVTSYGKSGDKVYLTEGTAVVYSVGSNGIRIIALFGEKIKVSVLQREIEAYRAYAATQTTAQDEAHKAELAAKRKAEEEARQAKYGLEGKSVAKVEIINFKIPEKFGNHTALPSYDLKTTLKNGEIISTEKSGEGYSSDYEITYNTKIDFGKLGKGFIEGDKYTMTVKCKSNPSITATKDVVVPYNQNMSHAWNGTSWSRSAGESGYNITLQIKQAKHAVTGEDILMVRLLKGSEVMDEYKIGIDQTIYLRCNGGKGGYEDGKGGFNGGNGGNITVLKDPNVKYYNLDYSNNGGQAGSLGASSGRDGVFKEEVRALKF